MNDSDQFLVYVCIYFNTSALHSSASGFSRKKMNKRYSGDAALFFFFFLIRWGGPRLAPLPPGLYTNVAVYPTEKQRPSLLFFFSFNFHY